MVVRRSRCPSGQSRNVVDKFWGALFDSSRQTIRELTSLQSRHLVACVTLMDTKVLKKTELNVEKPLDVFELATALQVLQDRNRAMSELTGRGVLVIDSPADKVSGELVNRYLIVKERMML